MEKEEFRAKLKVTPINEREKISEYNRFVAEQEKPFILFINSINKYINKLRKKGILSNFLEVRARIKASSSALRNDETKALDDVFGMEFICATEREIEILRENIEKLVSITKLRDHNKENGYKAVHCMYSIGDELVERLNQTSRRKYDRNLFPIVEAQYKTIQVFYESNYGTASHEKYKDTNIDEVQRLYNSGQLVPGVYLPYMWVSDPNNDNMRELSTEEIIRKIYPTLDLGDDMERTE